MSDLYIDQLGRVVELVSATPYPCRYCLYYDASDKVRAGGKCTESKFAPVDKQCGIGIMWVEVNGE